MYLTPQGVVMVELSQVTVRDGIATVALMASGARIAAQLRRQFAEEREFVIPGRKERVLKRNERFARAATDLETRAEALLRIL